MGLDPKMQAAIEEVEALVLRRYPGTQFRVSSDPEGSEAVHLTAVVDLDEPDEVVDLVLDRMMELLIEDDLPIYVIPIRTPERRAAMHAAAQKPPRALLPDNDVHEKIRRWLAEEGWKARDVDDPRTSLNITVTLQNDQVIRIPRSKSSWSHHTSAALGLR